jgi:hypothetical protein
MATYGTQDQGDKNTTQYALDITKRNKHKQRKEDGRPATNNWR